MWIVGSPKSYGMIGLIGFIAGFAFGVASMRDAHGAEYISVEYKLPIAGEVVVADPWPYPVPAGVFFTDDNASLLGGVQVYFDETAAFHVEQGVAAIPESPTALLILVGAFGLAVQRSLHHLWGRA